MDPLERAQAEHREAHKLIDGMEREGVAVEDMNAEIVKALARGLVDLYERYGIPEADDEPGA